MHPPHFLGLLFFFPLLVLAQDSSSGSGLLRPTGEDDNDNRPTPITTTIRSTFTTTLPNSQVSTGVLTRVVTTTAAADDEEASTSRRLPASNLPTAPSEVDRGGGSNGAPQPGQAGVGGAYGPDDNYISAVAALKRNALFVSLASLAVGAATVLL